MLANHQHDDAFGFTKKTLVVFVIAICLFAAARVWHLTTYGLWFDETFSLYAARLSWLELVRFVARDIVHPPLFYVLLKVWILIGGESLLWLKLFPLITSVASIIPLVLLCRELRLKAAEVNTALILMAVNSYLIYYAQELRMYSLLLFLTLLCLWLFFRLANGVSSYYYFLTLFIANLLLIYTHYFGWLVIIAECVYVILWKRKLLLPFFMTVVAEVFCFIPWVLIIRQAIAERKGLGENLGWLARPHLSDLIWYYGRLHGTFQIQRTTTLSYILFGSPLLLWAWRNLRHKEQERARSLILYELALFSFLPVTVAFIASFFLPQSVWGERYLIIAAVPYLLLVVLAVYKLNPLWVRAVFITLMISWAGLSSIYTKRDEERWNWYTLGHTMMRAEPATAGKTKVYAYGEFVASPIRFSLESLGERRFDIVASSDMFGTPRFDFTSILAASPEQHFWVAFRDANWKAELLPQTVLKNNGCQLGQEFSINGSGQKIIFFPVNCER